MVNVQLPETLTLESLALIAVLAIAVLTFTLIIVSIVRQPSHRMARTRAADNTSSSRREKRLDVFNRIARELGLDKVLARELEAMISEGLEKGRVRLSLASDECPGYVVLDVPSRRFLCIDSGGRAWLLEEREHRGEMVEYEDEEEVRGHGV